MQFMLLQCYHKMWEARLSIAYGIIVSYLKAIDKNRRAYFILETNPHHGSWFIMMKSQYIMINRNFSLNIM